MSSLTAEDVKKLTVPLLKNELAARGLDTTGLKAALTARLLEALADAPPASSAGEAAEEPAEAAEPAAPREFQAAVEGEPPQAEAEPPAEPPVPPPAVDAPEPPAPQPPAPEPAAPEQPAADEAEPPAAEPPAPEAEAPPAPEPPAPEPLPEAPAEDAELASAPEPAPPPSGAKRKHEAASPAEAGGAKAARAASLEPEPELADCPGLLVEGMVRPFTVPSFKQLLSSAGGVFGDGDLWLASIRNRCVVVLQSAAAAAATREALDGLEWPKGAGKRLSATQLTELAARRAIAEGSVAGATPTLPPRQPAAARAAPAAAAAAAAAPPPPAAARVAPQLLLAEQRVAGGGGPPTLDSLFKRTLATPSIYWLPLTNAQVVAKVKAAARKER